MTLKYPPHATMHTWFTAHPASIGESYWGHLRFALGFSAQLFIAAGAALLHALVPALCETTASDRIRALYRRIEHRRPAED